MKHTHHTLLCNEVSDSLRCPPSLCFIIHSLQYTFTPSKMKNFLLSETSIGIPNPKPRILQQPEFKQAHEGPLIPSDMDRLPEDLSVFKCISYYIIVYLHVSLAWLPSNMSLPMTASPYYLAVCSITCTTW